MASSKDDGTAAVSEQLGTMSLGKSLERKDNELDALRLAFSIMPTFSEALQAMYLARAEMRSKNRWLFVEYLGTRR